MANIIEGEITIFRTKLTRLSCAKCRKPIADFPPKPEERERALNYLWGVYGGKCPNCGADL
jgi:hypothetical protein